MSRYAKVQVMTDEPVYDISGIATGINFPGHTGTDYAPAMAPIYYDWNGEGTRYWPSLMIAGAGTPRVEEETPIFHALALETNENNMRRIHAHALLKAKQEGWADVEAKPQGKKYRWWNR